MQYWFSYKTIILNIRNRQLKIPGNILSKEGIDDLTLIGPIEGKKGRWGRTRPAHNVPKKFV